ncbi:unnamed protein product [Lota lota]
MALSMTAMFGHFSSPPPPPHHMQAEGAMYAREFWAECGEEDKEEEEDDGSRISRDPEPLGAWLTDTQSGTQSGTNWHEPRQLSDAPPLLLVACLLASSLPPSTRPRSVPHSLSSVFTPKESERKI